MNLGELINDPTTTLVDVRSPVEFKGGNVVGSVNIPLEEIPERVEEFKEMAGSIVVFCVSGMRSGQAASFLNTKGVTSIYNGGGWKDIKDLKSVTV